MSCGASPIHAVDARGTRGAQLSARLSGPRPIFWRKEREIVAKIGNRISWDIRGDP